jgi:hypothetical protein
MTRVHIALLAALACVPLASADIQLFWSTTGISSPAMYYYTAETNFAPWFVPYTHPAPLSSPLLLVPGTYDLFLWGQFAAGSQDYDQIYGLQLQLTGSATFAENVAYRQRGRWGSGPGIPLNHGVMAAVTSRGLVNTPPSDPSSDPLFIPADRTFLIGAAHVTLAPNTSLEASLDPAHNIAILDPDGNTYSPDPPVWPADVTSIGAPPTGACCLPASYCRISTESECNGQWLGANSTCTPNTCLDPGDLNCDALVDFNDIDLFVEALGRQNGNGWTHTCPWLNADCNGDGAVDFADIDPFVALIGTAYYD